MSPQASILKPFIEGVSKGIFANHTTHTKSGVCGTERCRPCWLLIQLLQGLYSELFKTAVDALIGEGAHEHLPSSWQITQLLHQVLHVPYVLHLLCHLMSPHPGGHPCHIQHPKLSNVIIALP